MFFGSFQNILARAAKYTVFDDSKEIAFIPLNQEAKIKGKAAIDGIGSRLGKSGSSFVFQTLLMIFSSSIFCSYTVFLLILFIMPTWFLSINSLNKKFKVLSIDKVNEINTKKAVNLKIANKKAALFNS